MAMTEKQKLFCREYLVDLIATQAAIRAGYSARSAGDRGHNLLRKPEVQAEIQRLKEERIERTERNGDEVVQRLWALVERATDEEDHVEARKNLALLGKHYGLFTEKLHVSGSLERSIAELLDDKEVHESARPRTVQ